MLRCNWASVRSGGYPLRVVVLNHPEKRPGTPLCSAPSASPARGALCCRGQTVPQSRAAWQGRQAMACCDITFTMPTKQWTKTRHMFTFWVTKEQAAAFRVACRAEGKRQTDVLRETVEVLIQEHVDAKS